MHLEYVGLRFPKKGEWYGEYRFNGNFEIHKSVIDFVETPQHAYLEVSDDNDIKPWYDDWF